jgi:predicted Ser/Thr protein kinase
VSEPSDSRLIDRADHPDRVWYFMRALGRSGLPGSFEIDGNTYGLMKSVKHDFFAATGFYTDDAGKKVVLKMERTACFLKLPMRWIGRALCRREMRFYGKLQDLPNVPRLLGMVGDTGFVHEYVEGRPLAKGKPVPDGFFQRLQELLAELHRRGIAYVDTNKPENILLGDDGLPHLIDFQISWDSPFLRRRLQREDFYHILKHKKRLRPDELTEEELARVNHISWMIRLHRAITKPYFFVRRRMFRRLRETGRLLPEGSK